MSPLLGGIEIFFVSLQPLDFVVSFSRSSSPAASHETGAEDADNGAFQFSEMIELRQIGRQSRR